MNRKIVFMLFVVFGFGYFLRVMYLPRLALTFGYDQARDAYVTQQILSGDLKILGPPASTQGLYHGVFYYYLLAPAYFLGKGSPVVAAYWIALVNSLTILVVFSLGFLMTRKIGTALLSAFLYAISFEATQYAVWLSNPTIAAFFVPLSYLGLWLWTKEGKGWGVILAGVGLGLSIQAEVFLLYHIVPFTIWLLIRKEQLNFRSLVNFFVALFFSLLTMIIAEVKFGFRGIIGASSLFASQEGAGVAKGLGDILVLFFNQIGKVFAFSTYPGNVGYGGIFVIVLIALTIASLRKGKSDTWRLFLLCWLLSHLTVVSVGGTSTPFLLVGIGPAVCLLVGINISEWWEKGYRLLGLAVLLIIIFGNISMGQTIFAIQKDMILSKQLSAIDYTYESAKGNEFSINSLTSPMWINIVWTYLYNWYGEPLYGYVPYWHGRGQEGQLSSLNISDHEVSDYYLVIEPMAGIPLRYLQETIDIEDSYSKMIEEKYFGEIRIQKRIKQ